MCSLFQLSDQEIEDRLFGFLGDRSPIEFVEFLFPVAEPRTVCRISTLIKYISTVEL